MPDPRILRALGPLLLAAALAVFLAEAWHSGPQYDDAYISYRYAANLVAGRGLVFNPGEYVEGFSNLLWTLLIAAGLTLGASARALGHGLGVLGGAGALAATWLYTRALRPQAPSYWAGLAAWIVLASAAFTRWSLSGMETPLFAAFVAAALAADARSRHGLATGLAALATLTRPEGALLAATLLGFRAFEHGARDRGLRRDALLYAGLCAALTGFRFAYYGALLPNTFYAKAGGMFLSLGALFASAFVLGNGGFCALPAALLVEREPRARPGAAFALAFLLYGVWIGGAPRYLAPLVPCGAALGCAGAALAWERGAAWRAASTAALGLAFAFCFLGGGALLGFSEALAEPARTRGITNELAADARGEQLARQRTELLRARGEPTALVATGAIGAFGFDSGLAIVDILGVVDPVVARSPVPPGPERVALPGHQRSNPGYVMSRRPDYVLIGNGEGTQQLPDWVPAVAELRARPELARDYVWDAAILGYRRVR